MTLERKIQEYPPLTGRLDRRFALPRALEIFRRLSRQLALRRLWPELPYMNYLRARPARGPGARVVAANPETGRGSEPAHLRTFHIHVALSPVIARIVRENFPLPVRELRYHSDSQERAPGRDRAGAAARGAGNAHSAAGDDSMQASRMVALVGRARHAGPVIVRALPAGDGRDGDFSENPVPAGPVRLDRTTSATSPAIGEREGSVSVDPHAATLARIARDHAIDLNFSATGFSASELNLEEPVLPAEFREYLQQADRAEGALPRTPPVAGNEKAAIAHHELDAGATQTGRVIRRRAARPYGRVVDLSIVEPPWPRGRGEHDRAQSQASSELTVSGRARPVVRDAVPEPAVVSAASERAASDDRQMREQVQATVHKTLRSLPEPEVEAFADRVSRSLERRLRVERDWRGDL